MGKRLDKKSEKLKRDLRDLEEFKKYLGETAGDYEHARIRRLQQDMFALAEILLDVYLLNRKRRRPEKNNLGGNFDTVESENYDKDSKTAQGFLETSQNNEALPEGPRAPPP